MGEFDPLPHWQALTVDALVLYGEIDSNVPSAESATRLRALDKANIDVRIYEGSGHALEDPEGQGDRIFREEALATSASSSCPRRRFPDRTASTTIALVTLDSCSEALTVV